MFMAAASLTKLHIHNFKTVSWPLGHWTSSVSPKASSQGFLIIDCLTPISDVLGRRGLRSLKVFYSTEPAYSVGPPSTRQRNAIQMAFR